MKSSEIDKKVEYILDQETNTARQLALHVIEKPMPHVWMIFIPIFFVFYFWKLKQFESGLKDFADNHLILRKKALDAVRTAIQQNLPLDINSLMTGMDDMPLNTRELYAAWLTILVQHFQLLLTSTGDSYSDLVHSGYRDKSTYQQFCRRLVTAETAFNSALLPTINGDSSDLLKATEVMNEGLTELLQADVLHIFPAIDGQLQTAE
jgi:hypothetical protein